MDSIGILFFQGRFAEIWKNPNLGHFVIMTGKGRGDDITADKKLSIQFQYCLAANEELMLPSGTHAMVAETWGVSRAACATIWARFKKTWQSSGETHK